MRKFSGFALRTAAAVLWALLAASISAGFTVAQENRPLKGVALVIGQSAYESLPALSNPDGDARKIEDLLARLGFQTDLATNEDVRKLRRSIDAFVEDAASTDVALVYYAGHGIEAGGENYLIPTDASPAALAAADSHLISLQSILGQLRGKARVTILLLDACRSNPFPAGALVKRDAQAPGVVITPTGLGMPRGALIVETDATVHDNDNIGEVIGFAAEPGQSALDGAEGANSPYAAALLKHLGANEGYDFAQVMTMVTEEVYLATGRRQRPWVNASLRRFLSFGGKATEPSSDDVLLTGARRKLLLAIAATPQDMRAAVEGLAQEQSLPLDPLYGMLRELQVDTTKGPEEIDAQLRRGAAALKKLLAEKVVSLRKDPELNRLAGLADRAQAEGAIALAKDYRAKASTRADALDKTLDQREAEVTADRVELASTYSDEAATAILAFDYLLAAEKYGKAYEQVVGRDPLWATAYKLSQADALFELGRYKGDMLSLRRAAAIYETIIGLTSDGRNPEAWASAQNNLGNTLQIIAATTGSERDFEKSISAFKATLTVRSRKWTPQDWALAQSNLGGALRNFGGLEADERRLSEAKLAYEAALMEVTPERFPVEWARATYGLALTRRALGDRRGDIGEVKIAIAEFEALLKAQNRTRDPLWWAAIQDNIGNALLVVAKHETGTASLRGAAAAFEAALSAWSKERTPVNWAMSQGNLGNAMQQLGVRETGTTKLMEATTAYEAALTELTRERSPLEWARITSSLGTTLQVIGERQGDPEKLNRAVELHEAALREATRDRSPLPWANIQQNLGLTLQAIGRREKNAGTLRKAIAAFEQALVERERQNTPIEWARSQHDIANTLVLLDWDESATGNLERGVKLYEAVLTEWTRDRVPELWAQAQANLGLTLLMIGKRESGTQRLTQAETALDAALIVWTKENQPASWSEVQSNLGLVYQELGGRLADPRILDKAVNAHEAALSVRARASDPHNWGRSQSNLAAALLLLGILDDDLRPIDRAAAAAQAALAELGAEDDVLTRALPVFSLGMAQFLIGEKRGDRQALENAKQNLNAAWTLYRAADAHQHDEVLRRYMTNLDRLLSEFPAE